MRCKFNIGILLFFSLLLNKDWVKAQTYFKTSDKFDQYFNQKIARFPNGDVLIGDSSLEPLRAGGTDGTIVMTRLDNCGNIVWSYTYVLPEGYLEFKDVKINAEDDVFVYGSFYQGLRQLIFLLKIEGTNGLDSNLRLFNPGTVDHFSYSLDLRNGLVMIYGLLFDFNTLKQGFVAIFNEKMSFLWAKKFTPFNSTGAAIISSDKGFMGRSGEYLIKLDQDGALEWAATFEAELNTHLIYGPLEVSGGFVFEAYQKGLSFFYKIDNKGRLVWKSNQFAAEETGAALSLLSNGNILCTYNCPDTETNQLCQLTISPDGQLKDQQQLVLKNRLNSGTIYQSISDNNIITIAGNTNLFSTNEATIGNFLMQFSLDSLKEGCFYWETFKETMPNNMELEFFPYDFTPTSFELILEKTVKPITSAFLPPLKNLCDEDITANLLQRDTFLPCEEDWLVSLPAPDFVWADNTPDRSRIVSLPGTYLAKKISCTQPIVVQYSLRKPDCGCAMYLPNAFSPNEDGLNDRLEFFSDCSLEKLEIIVFNRWGDLLFHSKDIDHFWNGTYQHKAVPTGVYLVTVNYQWIDFEGRMQQGSLFQDITLLR